MKIYYFCEDLGGYSYIMTREQAKREGLRIKKKVY